METIKGKYQNKLTLTKHSNTLYIIDFSNNSIGYTLLSDTSLDNISNKWNTLLNIINELIELDVDITKEDIKAELERIHGKLEIDFDFLYAIRKEFL